MQYTIKAPDWLSTSQVSNWHLYRLTSIPSVCVCVRKIFCMRLDLKNQFEVASMISLTSVSISITDHRAPGPDPEKVLRHPLYQTVTCEVFAFRYSSIHSLAHMVAWDGKRRNSCHETQALLDIPFRSVYTIPFIRLASFARSLRYPLRVGVHQVPRCGEPCICRGWCAWFASSWQPRVGAAQWISFCR